jgi:hypothetical protein
MTQPSSPELVEAELAVERERWKLRSRCVQDQTPKAERVNRRVDHFLHQRGGESTSSPLGGHAQPTDFADIAALDPATDQWHRAVFGGVAADGVGIADLAESHRTDHFVRCDGCDPERQVRCLLHSGPMGCRRRPALARLLCSQCPSSQASQLGLILQPVRIADSRVEHPKLRCVFRTIRSNDESWTVVDHWRPARATLEPCKAALHLCASRLQFPTITRNA